MSTTLTAQQLQDNRRGLMLVLSAPSGAGKSTIASRLLAEDDQVELSVSATTRARRSTEEDGVHYHFREKTQFEQMIQAGELLEWAQVHDNYYGTPRKNVEARLEEGKDVLFDIDVKGTFQLYAKMRSDVVSVFILPPSIAEMYERLKKRAEDSDEVIKRRMQTAIEEMRVWQDFDYIIVNEDLERAYAQLNAILVAERQKRARFADRIAPQMQGMIDDLTALIS
ncbi:guanylate kinase [Polycladidibacter hongkongensis]|uniref:guanylate kinase n=1 Tax=Polycladidibacter hongkongensis TaxID=1647556 RepID=UPI0008302B06|nr:guanylate kinase [Pseudovibrio hongkongensis]